MKITMKTPNQTTAPRCCLRHIERKTAIEAEVMTARTPVAYGPA
jgi:hypothetical protein